MRQIYCSYHDPSYLLTDYILILKLITLFSHCLHLNSTDNQQVYTVLINPIISYPPWNISFSD